MAGAVKSVEIFNLTMAAATGSDETVTFTKGQTLGQCVPFMTHEMGDTDIVRSYLVKCEITAGPKCKISRVGTLVDVDASAVIVEFDSAITVQQGTWSIADTATSGTASITSVVDTTTAFVVTYYDSDLNNDDFDDATVEVTFSSVSELTFTRKGSNGAISGTYFVVKCSSGEFSVQHRAVDIGTSSASQTDTITSIDTTKTFLIGSYQADFTSDNVRDAVAYAKLNSATEIELVRDTASVANTIESTIQVVTMSGGVVEQNVFTWGATEASETAAVSAPTDSAFQCAFHCMMGRPTVATAGTTSGDVMAAFQKLVMNSTTEVGATRFGASTPAGDAGDSDWQMVEWEEASGAAVVERRPVVMGSGY